MNWNRPVAELFDDLAFGLKLDSRIAVLSKYSNPVPVTRAASRMAPTTWPPTSLAPAIAMLLARFAPSAFMVNGDLTTVFREITHGASNRDPACPRRALLRGLHPRRGVRAQAHPDGDADGQH